MTVPSTSELANCHCKPCEGGVDPLTSEQAQAHLKAIPKWELDADGKSIHRKWEMKNFVKSMEFLQKVAEVAEQEQHHPDLHLTGYRNVLIELTTHAIGGLSENDFILAAKIDSLPS